MDEDTKKLGLKALLEKGDIEKFFDVQMREKDSTQKGQLIGSLARIADMVTQHSEGVMVDSVTDRIAKSLMAATQEISEGVSKDLENVEADLKELTQAENASAKEEALTRIDSGLNKIRKDVAKDTLNTLDKLLSEALPGLTEDAQLSEDERAELADTASLIVESQMETLIGDYFESKGVTVNQIKGFKEAVQSIIPEVDFSKASINWNQVKNVPNLANLGGGGKSLLKFLGDVDTTGITSGQTIVWNATIEKFEAGDAGGAPEGTAVLSTGETLGWVLQADGDGTSSWVELAGGGNALTSNPLSQFAATTSAQLAGVISDETGTGLLVFNNSPVLITPALGTPSALVLTNATALPLTTGVTGVLPIANGGTNASTASGARTALGVDAAGTDNSTDVTLGGTGTYISIAGQVITVDPITESDISDLGTYSTATGVENNADVTDTANVTSSGALMDSEVTNLAQVKAFDTTDYATSAQGTTADSAMQDVVDDTTPTLGGELDAGAHSIGFTMQTATGDGTTTVDWKLGNHIDFTFGAFNEVFTFTAPTKPGVYTMSLKQDSVGSRTATWPATVKWPAGTAPTLTTTATTGYDLIAFRYNGTNYYSTSTLNFS